MITNDEKWILNYLRESGDWRNSAQITTAINLSGYTVEGNLISHHDMEDILENMVDKKLLTIKIDKPDGVTILFRYPQVIEEESP